MYMRQQVCGCWLNELNYQPPPKLILNKSRAVTSAQHFLPLSGVSGCLWLFLKGGRATIPKRAKTRTTHPLMWRHSQISCVNKKDRHLLEMNRSKQHGKTPPELHIGTFHFLLCDSEENCLLPLQNCVMPQTLSSASESTFGGALINKCRPTESFSFTGGSLIVRSYPSPLQSFHLSPPPEPPPPPHSRWLTDLMSLRDDCSPAALWNK